MKTGGRIHIEVCEGGLAVNTALEEVSITDKMQLFDAFVSSLGMDEKEGAAVLMLLGMAKATGAFTKETVDMSGLGSILAGMGDE